MSRLSHILFSAIMLIIAALPAHAQFSEPVYSAPSPDVATLGTFGQVAYNISGAHPHVPYTSNSAERGHLLSKEYFGRDTLLERKEIWHYDRVRMDSLATATQEVVTFSSDPTYFVSANIGWLTRTQLYSYLPSMEWKVADMSVFAGWDFTYDGLGRLSGSNYRFGSLPAGEYDTAYTYDDHGNIRTISENGLPVPVRFYSYAGNHLQYALYDANGNLTKDTNHGLGSVQYNIINLPALIQKTTGVDTVRYAYTADGTKLCETVSRNGNLVARKDYAANRVYRNGNLRYILTDEGYLEYPDSVAGQPTVPERIFLLRDHLGSVRIVADTLGSVRQVNHYYPYGGLLDIDYIPEVLPDLDPVLDPEPDPGWIPEPGPISDSLEVIEDPIVPVPSESSNNPYKFIGKEVVGGSGLVIYDFGARFYSPYIPRWLTMDPFAEKYYGISPYAYCAGNPVNIVDRDGNIIDTAWDIASLGMGVASLISNIKARNVGAAIMDGFGIVADAAAVVLPLVPGGVSAGLKAARGAAKGVDVAIDAAKGIDEGVDAAKAGKNVTKTLSKGVHGNASASTKAQHAYDIIDKETREVVKTGVSGGAVRKGDGKSIRAESQVRKWNKEAGYEKYESTITHTEPAGENARRKIYDYEKKRAKYLHDNGQLNNTDLHKKP